MLSSLGLCLMHVYGFVRAAAFAPIKTSCDFQIALAGDGETPGHENRLVDGEVLTIQHTSTTTTATTTTTTIRYIHY